MSCTPPLAGWRVVLPRGDGWGIAAAEEVRARGGEPVIAPLIETIALPSEARRTAFDTLSRDGYDWLVVTSARAVEELPPPPARATRLRVASVGPATSTALRAAGWSVALQPQHDFSARGMLAAWPDETPRRILAPRSALAAATVVDGLRRRGHLVDDIAAYTTRPLALESEHLALLTEPRVALCLTSGTIARSLAAQLPREAAPLLASIGPQTTQDAVAVGLPVAITSETHTLPGLLDALAAHIASTTHPQKKTS